MSPKSILEQPKPHLIAHRGGNLAGENSKEAFTKSFNLGCKYLETDVIVTKDGYVIAYHGSKNLYMKRKSGLEKRDILQKMTLEEINSHLSGGRSKIILLEKLLNDFPNCFFSIDAKTDEVVKPLAEVIKKTGSAHRVSLVSFSLKRTTTLAKIVKSRSDQATGLCMYKIQAYPLIIFAPVIFKALKNKNIRILHVPYKCVNKRLLKYAHKNNQMIYAWSVNDVKSMERLISIGVDGIISDDVVRLVKFNKNKK